MQVLKNRVLKWCGLLMYSSGWRNFIQCQFRYKCRFIKPKKNSILLWLWRKVVFQDKKRKENSIRPGVWISSQIKYTNINKPYWFWHIDFLLDRYTSLITDVINTVKHFLPSSSFSYHSLSFFLIKPLATYLKTYFYNSCFAGRHHQKLTLLRIAAFIRSLTGIPWTILNSNWATRWLLRPSRGTHLQSDPFTPTIYIKGSHAGEPRGWGERPFCGFEVLQAFEAPGSGNLASDGKEESWYCLTSP